MTRARTSVAVVRGAALNPFEMQAYRPLSREFDVLLVGRHRPAHEVDTLGLPVRLLHAADEARVPAALARRLARRTARAEPGRLLGLGRAVRDRDILHGAETAIPTSLQCVEIARHTGARVVLTCWENIPFRFEEDPAAAARKQAVREACDLFLAVTPSARDALLAEGVASERVLVVPAGVDTGRFAPRPADRGIPAMRGVPDGAFVVLFVGRLIQEKGVVELVRAVSAVPASGGRPLHLVLAGDGPDARRVRAAAATLGCAHRVHIHQQVGYREVPGLYAAADLVVAPSLPTPYWQEQFGMVLVEAMASGRALITTRSGSIPEVVGDAAALVAPYDVAALADRIRALADDDAARRVLAEAGRSRAERYYAVDVVAAALAAAYRRVLRP